MTNGRSNQKRNERVPLQILISYEINGKVVNTFCNNLSEGGILIETLNPLPVGTRLQVKFNLPFEKKSFFIDSLVVWIKKSGPNITDPGMGLKFENMDDETNRLLDKALVYFKKMLGK